MIRKSIYVAIFAGLLVIAGLFGMRYWAQGLSQLAFVPPMGFSPPAPARVDDYHNPARWISHGDGTPDDPAHWLPSGLAPPPDRLPVLVFFIHPTSEFDKLRWNATLDDTLANARADLFTRGLASPFNSAAQVWAPRYRQATFGAFLTDKPDGDRALNAAYGDVLAAFDSFLMQSDPRLPIVLVGHSQGSFHLMRLMKERVAGRPLASRIVAAYVAGWPVSLKHDLPQMGLPACTAPAQSGCILSWQSFAEPADTSMVRAAYARFPGLDGQNRTGTPFLCTNPLTGRQATDPALASANLGTLVPDATLTGARLVPGLVPARCGPDGFLLIGSAPKMGPFVAPGNNYHVYDIPLFWANLRADFIARTAQWHALHPKPEPQP
ncbi:DUF3089 domain-containing protein [Novosphingobium rosa]|uniref:DUF3089 domain-containing protein n=1 Tax=Novosphingobium rosa TaxID=76978 RepID=UPI00082DE250|nr:DUF3089 domain-containing protein [Novosphingobium rosa]